jgi:hypothetical protein
MEYSPLSLIYSHIPATGVEDGMWWRVKKSGLFDIRSFYNVLQNPSSVVLFPWRSIWCSNAPQRLCFFVWSSAWDKILTCDNLMRRGYNMTSWCCMCGCSGETEDYLLLHCSMARALWSFVFRSFGVEWVVSERVVDLAGGMDYGNFSLIYGIWFLYVLCRQYGENATGAHLRMKSNLSPKS